MIIGFLADKIPYEKRRGWGIYSYNLLKALLKIDNENVYHCFYNIFRKGSRDSIIHSNNNNLKNFIWPIPGRIMFLLWEKLRILAADDFLTKADILHIPYEFLPKVRRVRTVVTVHDVTFLKHPENLNQNFVKRFTKRINHVAQHADIIIADSENTKQELIYFTNIDEDRVRVIPLGVDKCFMQSFSRDRINSIMKQYKITEPYILFVGAADEDKNLERLAMAFARIREKHKKLHLVFAGSSGWGYERLKEKLVALNIKNGILFTGFIPFADLPLLYSGASILAIPSLHEGFGLPALEAMACGTPVLCSNISSLPEVVGDAAVQIDPYKVDEIADGLQSILESESLRKSLIKKGIERSKQFTWENTAQKVINLYMEIADGK